MPSTRVARLALCAPLLGLLGACAAGSSGSSEDLGRSAGNTVHDTELMQAATAAVNETVRSAADCETARPLAASAQQRLDELEQQVRTAAGRVALDSLRAQLKRVQDACP